MNMNKILTSTALILALTTTSSYAGQTDAQMIEGAKEAVRGELKDGDSAKFRKLRIRPNRELPNLSIIYGEVNAKNSHGGYVGFKNFIAHVPFNSDRAWDIYLTE